MFIVISVHTVIVTEWSETPVGLLTSNLQDRLISELT